MKLLVAFSIVLLGSSGYASNEIFNPNCIGCFSFVAPSVVVAENIPAPEVGAIVYDTYYSQFRGYKADGSWTQFWSGTNFVRTVSTTATLNSADNIVIADGSSAAFTITLPDAALNSGKQLLIKKSPQDITFNQITLDPQGSQTIDGSPSKSLNSSNEAVTIVSDGSNWQMVNRRIPSEWVSYTPTFSGFGTATNIEVFYQRTGGTLRLAGNFTTGTATAVEARISLPSGLTSSSIPSIRIAGDFVRAANSTNKYPVLIEPNVSYITFSNSASGSFVKINGTSFNNTEKHGFVAEIPIAGWEG